MPLVPPEPKWLFSNRNYWYPQNQVTDYATARIRLTVPLEYRVVASGVPEVGSPAPACAGADRGLDAHRFRAPRTRSTRRSRCAISACVISRMTRVDAATVALDIVPTHARRADMRGADHAAAAADALQRRDRHSAGRRAQHRAAGGRCAIAARRSRGRDALGTAADILRFYASLIGDVPYDALTLAMVEDDLPGGHGPAYFAVLNNPLPIDAVQLAQRSGGVPGLPGVLPRARARASVVGPGGRLEELSRAVAQRRLRAVLRGALRAARRAASGAFRDMLRQFRRWAIERLGSGPGLSRLPARATSRARAACSARWSTTRARRCCTCCAAWSATRRSSAGCERFYADNRFKKAGTDDLRKAMEAASGRDLERFFERWIYDNGIPRLRFSTAVEGPGAGRPLRAGGRHLRRARHRRRDVYATARPSEFVVDRRMTPSR